VQKRRPNDRGRQAALPLQCGSPLVVNTGIAHRDAGVGEVGAGITRAPLDCFTKALTALAFIPLSG
jgi:hypothetical protein